MICPKCKNKMFERDKNYLKCLTCGYYNSKLAISKGFITNNKEIIMKNIEKLPERKEMSFKEYLEGGRIEDVKEEKELLDTNE